MTERKTTCRYLKAYRTQCTTEALTPDADVLLCARHLAAAQRVFREALNGASDKARG
jgi:hypothetical protein